MAKGETVDDVVSAMLRYADAMDVRQKEAAGGDRSLPCGVVALRMREFANRARIAHEHRAASRRWPAGTCCQLGRLAGYGAAKLKGGAS